MRRTITFLIFLMWPLVSFLTPAAQADISPYSAHGSTTDFCAKCHDVHDSEGDYTLTRTATVTGLCTTCHGLFGRSAPPYPQWTNIPTDFSGTDPTASVKLAYKVDMNSMTPAEMDAVPGHSLGIMLGGATVRYSDLIPGSSASLKVITSGAYGGVTAGLFHGEPATSFNGTQGLYCASCHTVHDVLGQMIPGSSLLSSRPNHNLTDPPATNETDYCIRCHDRRDNVGPEHNHPSQFCLNCHGNKEGESDFPHTSSNQKLLVQEPDGLCLTCHTQGTLP